MVMKNGKCLGGKRENPLPVPPPHPIKAAQQRTTTAISIVPMLPYLLRNFNISVKNQYVDKKVSLLSLVQMKFSQPEKEEMEGKEEKITIQLY